MVQARIAGHIPETDADLVVFMLAEAAAQRGYAESWHSFAENLLTEVGLDPGAVQGTSELAEVILDLVNDVHGALQRFVTVYKEVLEAVGEGLILPHNAREWLSGEGL
jgi:hypothetical protein